MVQAIAVPIVADALRSMVRFISRIPVWIMSFFGDGNNGGRGSTGFLELHCRARCRREEHLLDQLPMRRDAERFKSLDGYGRIGRHMGLVADGLGQLTPQFIE